MSKMRIDCALNEGEKIVKKYYLVLPINILQIADIHEINIEPNLHDQPGVSGMLIRVGDNFTIGYATSLNNKGHERFSIAHELGHYFLPNHLEDAFRNNRNIHISDSELISDKLIEREADAFATGLLMPTSLVTKEIDKGKVSLESIKRLALTCQTSLIAAAIRYTQLSSERVATIISSKSHIEYCFSSAAMQKVKGYTHPRKGSPLPYNAVTMKFNNAYVKTVDKCISENTDLIEWFHTDYEIDALEEVIGLGKYEKTLTIITADILSEDEEQD